MFTTATSHSRVFVVEVMGRYAGWIALNAGVAAGAHAILIPEIPFSLEPVAAMIKAREARGASFAIVVVAEGAMRRRTASARCSGRHSIRPSDWAGSAMQVAATAHRS